MAYEMERYCACGCWQEYQFEDGELEGLAAHVCTFHMHKLSEYLDTLGIDKQPEGQYTLTLGRATDARLTDDYGNITRAPYSTTRGAATDPYSDGPDFFEGAEI